MPSAPPPARRLRHPRRCSAPTLPQRVPLARKGGPSRRRLPYRLIAFSHSADQLLLHHINLRLRLRCHAYLHCGRRGTRQPSRNNIRQSSATIFHEIGKPSKGAFQYASQMTPLWYLRKNQYQTCPNPKVAQTKDSTIVF